MEIVRYCPFEKKDVSMDLDVTKEQLFLWQNGKHAQDVFSHLTPGEREFIISGIRPEFWDKYFKPEEKNNDIADNPLEDMDLDLDEPF